MSGWERGAQDAGEKAYLEMDEGDCCCETCIVRTVLEAAWDHLATGVLAEAREEQLAVDPAKLQPEWVPLPHRLVT